VAKRHRSAPPKGRSYLGWFPVVAAVLLAVAGIAFVEWRNLREGPTPWSRLGTRDVHALAFVAKDLERLLFGHHGGLRATDDGGRTWRDLSAGSDAIVEPDEVSA